MIACGDDTARHKSCYYRWSNAVAFQSHPRRARVIEKNSSFRLTPFFAIMVTRLTYITRIAAVLEEPSCYYQITPLPNVTILLSHGIPSRNQASCCNYLYRRPLDDHDS
jgi:hypothetical protein